MSEEPRKPARPNYDAVVDLLFPKLANCDE